jgi:hypothetical protein
VENTAIDITRPRLQRLKPPNVILWLVEIFFSVADDTGIAFKTSAKKI